MQFILHIKNINKRKEDSMITDQEIKTLFLEAKDCEVKAEANEVKYISEIERREFFRGKKEAYQYISNRIELLMKWKSIQL